MNERSLQIFTEVYRAGSVHLAAQRLFISAQSVSKTILALEDELGEPLFVREHHRMLPTPRAGRLQRQAERILREFRMIRSAARSGIPPSYSSDTSAWRNFISRTGSTGVQQSRTRTPAGR